MNRTLASSLLASVIALVVTGCSASSVAVKPVRTATGAEAEYDVSIPSVAAEEFHVDATLRGIDVDTITYYFPVWAPGAYDIVNFGGYVHNFRATNADGVELTVLRSDTNTFRIVGGGEEVRLSYDIDDIEYIANSAWFGLSDIEKDFAFANGTALFGYVDGLKDIPHEVTYDTPYGWKLAVALDPVNDDNRYRAASYDELADAPIQMGAFQRLEFNVNGIPHIITVTAPEQLHDTVATELVATTRRIVEAMSALFGEMPYKRYMFQHYLVELRGARGGFGALEHSNSSTYRMPFHSQESVVSTLAPVIAHEYWHLWSPKRFHVHQLGPFDYQNGPVTSSLWFAEGLTEYYARAINSRIGLSSPRATLRGLLRDMGGLYRRAQHEPMTELSRRITSAPMSELIDLYKKGPLLGFLLDTEIRWQTDNRRSLDDAMRAFDNDFAKRGLTFSDDDIIPIMERATGAKLAEFYTRYIAGRDTLPFDEGFRRSGLAYIVRDTVRPTFGAVLEPTRAGVRIAQVFEGESAAAMGLKTGDIVNTLDVDGYSVPVSAIPLELIDQIFADSDTESPGNDPRYSVRAVTFTRDGKTQSAPAIVLPGRATIERLDIDPSASGKALEIRRAMLGF